MRIDSAANQRVRPSGQRSTRSSTHGTVTSIGLLSSPRVKKATEAMYHAAPPRRAKCVHAASVSRKKKPLRTSFRSATQATDSTCSGWSAKIAATIALRAIPAGHAAEDEVDEDDVGAMEQQIDRVMPARMNAEELAVEHVRKPGQRVVVGDMRLGECPGDSAEGQALLDDGVFGDVGVVVHRQELGFRRRPVDRKCRDDQGDADQGGSAGGRQLGSKCGH